MTTEEMLAAAKVVVPSLTAQEVQAKLLTHEEVEPWMSVPRLQYCHAAFLAQRRTAWSTLRLPVVGQLLIE
jgi:hypothetical protein